MKESQFFRTANRFAIVFLSVVPFATASLLLDPLGGSSVGLPADPPNAQVTRDIGGTFNLFGNDITNINVAADGFLGTGQVRDLFLDRDIPILAEVSGGLVIAPFYDSLAIGNGSTITDQSVANTYYAVTYQAMYTNGDTTAGHTSDFQVILFMADTSVSGFQFLAGDIAMSYGNLASTPSGTFSVGVGTDRTNFTGTPEVVDGELQDFSTLPSGSQFFLYRPHSDLILPSSLVAADTQVVRYGVSLESTTVPEPAAMALVGFGLAALCFRKRR